MSEMQPQLSDMQMSSEFKGAFSGARSGRLIIVAISSVAAIASM